MSYFYKSVIIKVFIKLIFCSELPPKFQIN